MKGLLRVLRGLALFTTMCSQQILGSQVYSVHRGPLPHLLEPRPRGAHVSDRKGNDWSNDEAPSVDVTEDDIFQNIWRKAVATTSESSTSASSFEAAYALLHMLVPLLKGFVVAQICRELGLMGAIPVKYPHISSHVFPVFVVFCFSVLFAVPPSCPTCRQHDQQFHSSLNAGLLPAIGLHASLNLRPCVSYRSSRSTVSLRCSCDISHIDTQCALSRSVYLRPNMLPTVLETAQGS